ncbi:FAD-dependent monooxygenase [Caldimonas tepidiphila]|uniref:FAD-dependent monooxygenase n=1 Tax=Caldimonas tepidiphila TaxID=2315841 RepID=UPI000E5B2F28|nr:FAD-dependent monooxygenase [Caldimonas tepidiphila]
MKHFQVAIRGSGIVGKTLALSLARSGFSVALSAPASAAATQDLRTYALSARAVALLQSVKVWDALPAHAATPVYDMRIEGDVPGGGPLEFSAWEQGVRELTWIVDAGVLEEVLDHAVRFQPHVTLVEGEVSAELLALCEGKASRTREALGVQWDRRPYGHTAIGARLVADAPHQGVARQWFRSPDVLALLPFDRPQPGHSYGLVWSVPESRVDALMALDDAAFADALTEATGGAAGRLRLSAPRGTWPLAIARADRWCGPGWVLLGDAAHVVHPLAGQGLNLGLADVECLSRVLATREGWRRLGDERLLRRYERERALPTWAMGSVTDGLLHLFAAPDAPLRELRNRGLGLVNRLTPIKRWLTRQALDT